MDRSTNEPDETEQLNDDLLESIREVLDAVEDCADPFMVDYEQFEELVANAQHRERIRLVRDLGAFWCVSLVVLGSLTRLLLAAPNAYFGVVLASLLATPVIVIQYHRRAKEVST